MMEGSAAAIDYGMPRRLVTALLFGLAGLFAVASLVANNDRGTLAQCAFGAALLAVLWPIVGRIDTLKFGVGGVELTKKVDEANAKADIALATLSRFVFNSMPQPTFHNLQKIESGRFGKFEMTDGFRQQLRNLRDSGYIQPNGIAIGNIPVQGPDLSLFVYVTDLGREFIAQRLATQAAAARPPLSAA